MARDKQAICYECEPLNRWEGYDEWRSMLYGSKRSALMAAQFHDEKAHDGEKTAVVERVK